METTIHTTTITNPRDESATISWMSLEVTGFDQKLEEHGYRTFAFGPDECPVRWERNNSYGWWELRHNFAQFSGDFSVDERARRVDSLDELEPGTYYIHEEES